MKHLFLTAIMAVSVALAISCQKKEITDPTLLQPKVEVKLSNEDATKTFFDSTSEAEIFERTIT